MRAERGNRGGRGAFPTPVPAHRKSNVLDEGVGVAVARQRAAIGRRAADMLIPRPEGAWREASMYANDPRPLAPFPVSGDVTASSPVLVPADSLSTAPSTDRERERERERRGERERRERERGEGERERQK